MKSHKGSNISTHRGRKVFIITKFGGLRWPRVQARKASGKKFKSRSCLTYWTDKGLRVAHCSARSNTTRAKKYRAKKSLGKKSASAAASLSKYKLK